MVAAVAAVGYRRRRMNKGYTEELQDYAVPEMVSRHPWISVRIHERT
jgi:hypothetical protein